MVRVAWSVPNHAVSLAGILFFADYYIVVLLIKMSKFTKWKQIMYSNNNENNRCYTYDHD